MPNMRFIKLISRDTNELKLTGATTGQLIYYFPNCATEIRVILRKYEI